MIDGGLFTSNLGHIDEIKTPHANGVKHIYSILGITESLYIVRTSFTPGIPATP
jgi:hypothetical protein